MHIIEIKLNLDNILGSTSCCMKSNQNTLIILKEKKA